MQKVFLSIQQSFSAPGAVAGDHSNHGSTQVRAYHNGYAKEVCVYLVHMMQPPVPAPAPGLITDLQACKTLQLCMMHCLLTLGKRVQPHS